jgi:HlyD family secretion protein
VTASGKIEAKTSVDISADITGRIIRIAVREGDRVHKGQFLLQIDPAQYQAAVSRAQGVVASTEATLAQTRASLDQAERAWKRARELSQLGPNLITPESAEQAQTAYDVAQATYQATRAQLEQSRASLQEARDNLAKTRLVSPITGRVVRLAVEEGEVAVPGTFSRETGLLKTIADLSVILGKVQVDETDVVRLSPDDSVQVTIDAYPDTSFVGRVTKISHSAKLTATQTASGSNDRAVDFDVEVTLENPPRDVRPDLSCTARIVTDTRTHVLSIPIIALTVRDDERLPNESDPNADTTRLRRPEHETEGVFVVRGGEATFRPVKVGIAGDEYFEVRDGLRGGETIVAGTYQAIRDLRDGARVTPADTTRRKAAQT